MKHGGAATLRHIDPTLLGNVDNALKWEIKPVKIWTKYEINKHVWLNTVLRSLAFKSHFLVCFRTKQNLTPIPTDILTRYSHF